MAKKSTGHTPPLRSRPWRHKAVLGGVILAVVLGVGGGVRWWQQHQFPLPGHGTGEPRYTRGPAGAPVTIQEFSAYTCAHCQTLQEPLERAMQHFEGQVQLVVYPVVFNPLSAVATHAAWCAGEQGKFWDVHRMLYQRQEFWSHPAAPLARISAVVTDVPGLDPAALQRCVESGRMQARIQADQTYGQQLHVQSTPTLFINATRIVGSRSEAELIRLIRQEVARVQRPS